ncbi:rRNA maturation RNase YbeY [Flavobacteriaceae bacterium]|nr:rRNA maturation RNase YbeY [Flavobacteriaceae bacterium]MDA8643888.1 rRNA maturation RNase YbeY [Flavobacteriaceae bacterium]MDA9037160.1 rRNA maturation RNase YbeY [Flavobacteriaceae bacterium]MDA9851479.1 rRNA maturation RNase YbeY [Flavobacteriaceae bacterium]
MPEFLKNAELESVLMDFVREYKYTIGKLSYNFVSKEELLKMNQEYLNHDTHTDIITFDYSSQKTLSAEIFISMWAIRQSAKDENQTTENETLRVISHGVLHCMGLNDKKREEKAMMRKSENRFIELFHVKQKKYV